MDTDSEAKDINLKYDLLAVLFSFLFQLLKNLMHSEPDHDPGTAFTAVSEKGICSSGDRYQASELVLDFFFLIGVVLEVQLRSDRFTRRNL